MTAVSQPFCHGERAVREMHLGDEQRLAWGTSATPTCCDTSPHDFLPALQKVYKIAHETSMPTLINVQGKKELWLREKYPPSFLGKIEPGVMSYYH